MKLVELLDAYERASRYVPFFAEDDGLDDDLPASVLVANDAAKDAEIAAYNALYDALREADARPACLPWQAADEFEYSGAVVVVRGRNLTIVDVGWCEGGEFHVDGEVIKPNWACSVADLLATLPAAAPVADAGAGSEGV